MKKAVLPAVTELERQSYSGFQVESSADIQLFPHKKVLQILIIAFLFMAAFGVRLYRITEPPLEFHPVRQYRAAIIARGYFYETATSIPEWKKQVASSNNEQMSTLEPPILELIASWAFWAMGAEHLWMPRALSSVFWLIGGLFLYLIAQKIASIDAAVCAIGFYLFLPFGVIGSRSFQPDPLMVMMLVISIFTIVRYFEQPSPLGFAVAVVATGAAILIKPVCLFPIFGALACLAVCQFGWRNAVTRPYLYSFVIMSLCPTVLYYSFQLFIANAWALHFQAGASFHPQLLFQAFFWRMWFEMIVKVLGYLPLVSALLGVFLVRKGLPRALLMGLWLGYLLFGLVFTYHIHTHDYYQMQLIPIASLSLAPIGAAVMNQLSNRGRTTFYRVAVWCILLMAPVFSIRELRWTLMHPGYEGQVRILQDIGEQVSHTTRALFLTADYGMSLRYHGELAGYAWLTTEDLRAFEIWGRKQLPTQQRFDALWSEYAPEYFIITNLREYNRQIDLRDLLTRNFHTVIRSDDYLIFDLRKKATQE